MGRFTTEDTVLSVAQKFANGQKIEDPLSLNLYTYCYSDPIDRHDPSGHVAPVIYGLYLYACTIAASPDTAQDLANIAIDISEGDYLAAAFDLVGVLLPGGTNLGKASKPVKNAVGKVISFITSKTGKSFDDVMSTVIRNGMKSRTVDSLADNAKTMYKKYNDTGWKGTVPGQTPGTKAGSTFKNSDGLLPKTDGSGKEITYKEFDINNKMAGQDRDAERFVRGSDGSVYYTNDHYDSFTKVE